MLRKIAMALIAATMLTAPALARGGAATTATGSPNSVATVAKPAANTTRASRAVHKRAKNVRHVTHVKKHARKHALHSRNLVSAKHVRHIGMTRNTLPSSVGASNETGAGRPEAAEAVALANRFLHRCPAE